MELTVIALGVAIFGIGTSLYYPAAIQRQPKKQAGLSKQMYGFGIGWMAFGLVIAIVGLFA